VVIFMVDGSFSSLHSTARAWHIDAVRGRPPHQICHTSAAAGDLPPRACPPSRPATESPRGPRFMPRRKCIGQIYFLVVFRQYYRSTALRGKSGQSREPRKNLEPKDQRGWRSPAPEWGMSLRYFFSKCELLHTPRRLPELFRRAWAEAVHAGTPEN